jgi:hypothetical protein
MPKYYHIKSEAFACARSCWSSLLKGGGNEKNNWKNGRPRRMRGTRGCWPKKVFLSGARVSNKISPIFTIYRSQTAFLCTYIHSKKKMILYLWSPFVVFLPFLFSVSSFSLSFSFSFHSLCLFCFLSLFLSFSLLLYLSFTLSLFLSIFPSFTLSLL